MSVQLAVPFAHGHAAQGAANHSAEVSSLKAAVERDMRELLRLSRPWKEVENMRGLLRLQAVKRGTVQ